MSPAGHRHPPQRFPVPRPSPSARRRAADEYAELLDHEHAEERLIERLRHLLTAARIRLVETRAKLDCLRAIFCGYDDEGAP